MAEHYEGTKLGWINYKVMLDYTDDKNFNAIQRNKRIKDGLKKEFAGTIKTIDSIATGMAKFSQNMNPPKKKRYRYKKTREYY
ncbi:hypothetical protein AAA799E16_02077 [Marine Group I thaumarchaeote SCGC AAA799-E16]|uniref:Uncharacterized protein n=2 Tax=Marine Group I TaxID=905826 RepID=A0A087RQF5_9ARCH|nr:hypothetical protein AAA799E16_02077 [Marine Group I thaumarchaeote SCGC AAA799-E16]KFM15709.1 hypothetical protein SCCGRSA3_02607 [Marine Group I thaumarchaeote SCGC RSA3]